MSTREAPPSFPQTCNTEAITLIRHRCDSIKIPVGNPKILRIVQIGHLHRLARVTAIREWVGGGVNRSALLESSPNRTETETTRVHGNLRVPNAYNGAVGILHVVTTWNRRRVEVHLNETTTVAYGTQPASYSQLLGSSLPLVLREQTSTPSSLARRLSAHNRCSSALAINIPNDAMNRGGLVNSGTPRHRPASIIGSPERTQRRRGGKETLQVLPLSRHQLGCAHYAINSAYCGRLRCSTTVSLHAYLEEEIEREKAPTNGAILRANRGDTRQYRCNGRYCNRSSSRYTRS